MLSSDKAAGLAVVLAIVVKVGGFTVALAA
jgi:hypothetical protein